MVDKTKKHNVLYCHSRCCGSHWELVVADGNWTLECEKCGQPVGGEIQVTGPEMNDCSCEECEKEQN